MVQLYPLLQNAILLQTRGHQLVKLTVVEICRACEPDAIDLHADEVVTLVLRQQEVTPVGVIQSDIRLLRHQPVDIGEMTISHSDHVRRQFRNIYPDKVFLMQNMRGVARAIANHQCIIPFGCMQQRGQGEANLRNDFTGIITLEFTVR